MKLRNHPLLALAAAAAAPRLASSIPEPPGEVASAAVAPDAGGFVFQPFVLEEECIEVCPEKDPVLRSPCDKAAAGTCLCPSGGDPYCAFTCFDDKWLLLCQDVAVGPTPAPTKPPPEISGGMQAPDEVVFQPFVVEEGCTDVCPEKDPAMNSSCDEAAVGTCRCPSSSDPYCAFDCFGDQWNMLCMGGGIAPPPPETTGEPTPVHESSDGTTGAMPAPDEAGDVGFLVEPFVVEEECIEVCPEKDPQMFSSCDMAAAGTCLCPMGGDPYCAFTCLEDQWVGLCQSIPPPPQSTEAPTPVPTKPEPELGYGLFQDQSFLCIEIAGNDTDSGTRLRFNTCEDGKAVQLWKFDEATESGFRGKLRSKADDSKCVEADEEYRPGKNIRIYDCDDSKNNQKWEFNGVTLFPLEETDFAAYSPRGYSNKAAKLGDSVVLGDRSVEGSGDYNVMDEETTSLYFVLVE